MRFAIFTCFFLALVSCSSPGRRFSGVEPVRVMVEKTTFDVYVLGNDVRVIRMNFAVLPTLTVIGPRAVAAMEQVTGCSVISNSFSGDQAMADARVSC